MNLRHKYFAATVSLALAMMASTSSAATISWTPQLFTDVSQLYTDGIEVAGYNFGNASGVSVNGLQFAGNNAASLDDANFRWTADGTKNNAASTDTYNDANTVTGLSVSDANTLLDGFSWSSAAGVNGYLMTLKNLTPGRTYVVQALAVDDRSCCQGRNLHFGPDGDNWGPAYDYTGIGGPLLVTGTFVADAVTQDFRNGVQNDGGAHLNAIHISFVPAPEPSTIALASLGLLGLCTASRRRRRS